MSLFILPVLVGFDLIVKRSLKRSVITLESIAIAYLTIYFLTGYDAWHAFRAASLYENPNGFMLFVDPWNYLFTRIEDVAELIFFFGPFLSYLLIKGSAKLRLGQRIPQPPALCADSIGVFRFWVCTRSERGGRARRPVHVRLYIRICLYRWADI